MILITCVLKTGGWKNRNDKVEYTPQHVQWLANQINKHVTIPHRFVCLSDIDIPFIRTIPLEHNWPGWWSKIELFKRGLFYAPIFYIDLDTVIISNIDHILQHYHHFTALRQFTQRPDTNHMGSGIMAWDPVNNVEIGNIYEIFSKNPNKYMEEYVTIDKWGDQRFIQDHISKPDFFQMLFPNEIISFKTDLNQGDPVSTNKIICFHGQPKPEDINRVWIPPFAQ